MKPNYLTLPEISRVLDVAPAIVASWLTEGSLQTRATPKGEPRVAALALVHLLLRKGIALPQGLKSSMRLLVIDDEPEMLRSTARLLKRSAPHLDVTLAEGAENGLRMIRELTPDAVLLDMYMPVFTGLELCVRIKQLPKASGIILVAFSGRRDAELEREFKRAGAVALLDKPPDVQQLLSVLESESIGEPTS